MHKNGSGDGKPRQKMTIDDCGQLWFDINVWQINQY